MASQGDFFNPPIKYNVWWRTNKSPGDPPSLHENWWWEKLKFTRLTLEELVSSVREEEITHLMFNDNPTSSSRGTLVPANLPEDIKHSLKHFCTSGVRDKQQVSNIVSCLSNMRSLESLCLHDVNLSSRPISDEMRNILMRLKLKHLTLRGCGVTADVLTGISKMSSLEELNLSENKLSRHGSLSDKLSTLTFLKRLNLSSCDLTEIPQSISQMKSLEELNLSRNNLSRDGSLSVKLSTLTSLKRLDLFLCGLTEIPQSISLMTSLEELNLSHNNLRTDSTLSDKQSTLTSLKRLDLWSCDLTEIPQSVQGMTYLEKLHVGYNKIEVIPEWIESLVSLRELNLTGNNTLKRLHRNICSLPLTELNVSACDNLSEPPKYVCKGGLEHIRQYCNDIDEGSHSMMLASVVVIGRKMAGKTSLIKSLQAKKIVPTYRIDGALGQTVVREKSSGVDETTKVFNLIELCLTDPDRNQQDKIVNVVDFGGDEIYHHAYQLTFRKNCKPIVVVNIIQYKKESELYGRREATRRVLFDWIAHLYLACPQLDRPLLVLTHRDLAGQRFAKLKEELMTTMTELYREMLQDKSVNKDMKIMMSKNQGSFFLDSEIFEIDHLADYGAVYAQLENVLYQRVSGSEVVVPLSWKEIMDSIKNRQQSHVTTREMCAGLRGDSKKQVMVILDFMRRSGQILWYKAEEDDSFLFDYGYDYESDESDESDESVMHPCKLADIIFHDVSKVTNMIKTLFNHSSVESKSVLEKAEMEQMWQTNPSDESSQIPTDIAINLLTKFNLIYGPSTVNHNPECYLIPYFMKKHQFTPSKSDINLQGEMAFIGLSIPVYAYQQMTVSFLKLIQQSEFEVAAFGNGAAGRLVSGIGAASEEKVIEAQLIHEPENQRVVTKVQGDVSCAHQSWELFLKIIRNLSDTVKTAWQAARIRYDIICPHCILLDEFNPEKRSNPDFLMKAISSDTSGRHDERGPRTEVEYREDYECRTVTGVPSPLRYPCGELSDIDMQSLVRYIRNVRPDEQQEITRLVGEIDNNQYDMTPYFQTALYPRPTADRLYQMTRTRGRALIINNRHGDITDGGGGRRGSDKDYTNMKNMLERFGFIISHFSQDGDWTSHAIVEAIHKETKLVYQGTTSVHEGLGMFVLVMMSHGDVGTISGCDYEESYGQKTYKHVSLVDVYKLLSSQYFPAMRGKPKLVVLQACSGVRAVRKRRASQIGREIPPTPTQPGQPIGPQRTTLLHSETNTDESYQTIDDLLVMKPSFDEHVSYRDPTRGSYFIRALIATFCRYSGEKDVRTLCDLIQEAVRNEVRGQGVEQVPVTISTFTNGRKLFMSPGVNMRTMNHPESFTSRELPPPGRRRISLIWRDDEEAPVTNYPSEKKKIVRFEVERNPRRVI